MNERVNCSESVLCTHRGVCTVEEIYERALNVTRDATLTTDMRLQVEMVVECHDYLLNEMLLQTMLGCMKRLGPRVFDNKNVELPRAQQATLLEGTVGSAVQVLGLSVEDSQRPSLCRGA